MAFNAKTTALTKIATFEKKLVAIVAQQAVDTWSIPDSVLDQTVKGDFTAALQTVANSLGIKYAPNTAHTYTWVRKSNGYAEIVGPRVGSYDDGIAIVWEDQYFHIAGGDLSNSDFRLRCTASDFGGSAVFNYEVDNIQMAFPLMFDFVAKENREAQFDAIQDARDTDTLSGLLRSCVTTERLGDLLQDGDAIVIKALEALIPKDHGKKFAILSGHTANNRYCHFFAPGHISLWGDSAIYPVTAARDAYKLHCVASDNSMFEVSLGRIYIKLGDLEEGQNYKVLGFKIDIPTDAKYKPSAIMEVVLGDGTTVFVRGNQSINNLLMLEDTVINEPATLYVDKITERPDGKKAVQCRLALQELE